eukprot:gene971-1053_t
MPRSVDDIEADIAAIKRANPRWAVEAGDKALITALITEKNQLLQGTAAGGSGTDTIVIQRLKNIESQLQFVANMGIQLDHVVAELVERKTSLTSSKKDGSQASAGDFSRFFSFSIFPAETWLTSSPNTEFRESARKLIHSHQSAMKTKCDAGLVKEVEHVQGDSKELLQKLMDIFFFNEQVEIVPERPYSCKVTNRSLESIRYSGKTDAVIKSSEYDVAVLCWEIKNQFINLEAKGEIAQTAAEVAGELEAMSDRFDIKPRRYAAVLTNGVTFLFVMAAMVNGVYSWRHSPLVTNAASAAAMIEGCFAVAVEVLRLFNKSFDVPLERLQLEDNGDNDGSDRDGDRTESSGAGGNAKSRSSLGASLGGISRVLRSAIGGAVATKTSGGANKTIKKDADSQDHRYAPLTMSNLDLFNRMRGGLFSF